MTRIIRTLGSATLVLSLALPVFAGGLRCPRDAVQVGNVCVDAYEASVWQIPPSNTRLVKRVFKGKATLAHLLKGGATQVAPAGTCSGPSDYGPNFPNSGNWTAVAGSNAPSPGIYAVSIPGVKPSGCLTWFQANQACALSGKRLIRNDEWQRAAAGTADPGSADDGSTTCATNSAGPVDTGSRSNCKSAWGVYDMVGNVAEWVADWADNNFEIACTNWTASGGIPGADTSCFGGPGGGGINALPAALTRGGTWFDGILAGVFTVGAGSALTNSGPALGFRCAR